MIGHVAFVAQQLFVRVLLDTADVAVTPATGFIGIILTVLALRSI